MPNIGTKKPVYKRIRFMPEWQGRVIRVEGSHEHGGLQIMQYIASRNEACAFIRTLESARYLVSFEKVNELRNDLREMSNLPLSEDQVDGIVKSAVYKLNAGLAELSSYANRLRENSRTDSEQSQIGLNAN